MGDRDTECRDRATRNFEAWYRANKKEQPMNNLEACVADLKTWVDTDLPYERSCGDIVKADIEEIIRHHWPIAPAVEPSEGVDFMKLLREARDDGMYGLEPSSETKGT